MNRGIRIAQNEFKAAAGALGDWKESQEGISARIKSLNDIMELQRAKVEKLNKEYDDLKGSGTASEASLKKLQEQISKANAELGKSQGEFKDATKKQDEFGKETVDATQALDKFGKEADQAGTKTSKLSGFLKSAGSAMKSGITAGAKAVGASMAAIGTATAAAGVAVVGFAKKALENADAIQKQADVTGLSAEKVQELSYVAATAGVEFDTLAGAQGKLTKSMFAATTSSEKQYEVSLKQAAKVQELVDSHAGYSAVLKELGKNTDISVEQQKKLAKELISGKITVNDITDAFQKNIPEASAIQDAFQKLGINVNGANGELRNSQEVMTEALGALGGISNETERDAIAMQLFGKSAMELNPLIKLSAEEMANLTEEARKTGAVISNENIAAMDSAGDSIESLKQSAMGLGSSLVAKMLPALTDSIDGFKGLATQINAGDWSKVGQTISDMLVTGVQKLSAALPQLITTVTTVLNQLVAAIVPLIPVLLPVLLQAAMQLMQGLFDAISKNVQPLMDMVTMMLTMFAKFILDNLPMIIAIGLQMIIALMLGIAQALPTMIPTIIQTVTTIIDVIIQNLPMFIQAAVQIILALVNGLIAALPQLIAWLPQIINSIVQALVSNLGLLIQATIQIILALVQGLIQNIPLLIAAIPQLISAIVGGLITAAPQLALAVPQMFRQLVDSFKNMDWTSIGKNIIDGIKNGIANTASNLATAAKNAATGALGSMKKILGINSPSTVFRDQIGVNMGLGVAEGIKNTTSKVTSAMSNVTDKLKTDVQVNGKVNVSGTAEQSSSTSGQALLQIGTFINNTDKDIETLAYQFEFMRRKAQAALGG